LISQLATDALTEAHPYLQDSGWVKEKLASFLVKAKTVEQLTEMLEEEIRGEPDPAKQTDLKIYLMYLEKMGRQRRG